MCVHHLLYLLKAIFYLTILKYKLRSFVSDGCVSFLPSFPFLLSSGNEQFYTKFNINDLTWWWVWWWNALSCIIERTTYVVGCGHRSDFPSVWNDKEQNSFWVSKIAHALENDDCKIRKIECCNYLIFCGRNVWSSLFSITTIRHSVFRFGSKSSTCVSL